VKKTPNKIIFYDSDCGFCNHTVQFVLKYQKDSTIHFSAIQSKFTHSLFAENNWDKPDLSTVYFYKYGHLFEKSDAGIQISKELRFPINLFQFFWIVPQYLRDIVYDFIAKQRHKIKKGYCVVPSEQDRKRFINLIKDYKY
jgi:predicted DCC family thiol-disulfide oxidoreductase YuxK